MEKDLIMWMVRAGENAYIIEDFLKKKLVAIGWHQVGDLSKLKDIDRIKDKLRSEYPHFKPGQVNAFAAILYKFYNDFGKGHLVLTYDPNERLYWIGEIVGDYKYEPDKIENFPHLRRVEWKKSVSRDSLSTTSKNSLGSTLTIFSISEIVSKELLGEEQPKVEN